MIKRGRPPNAEATVEWKISVPLSIANKVTLILADPLSGSVRYGSRSKLIELLLRNWLNELTRDAQQSAEGDTSPAD